jgi:hypothetical protein
MKREYKEAATRAGIFVITKTVNGKRLLGSSKNLHGPLNKHRFMLSIGGHDNRDLQADWNRFGADAFRFEVVAEVEDRRDDPAFSLELELSRLEEEWLDKTQSAGERGYNRDARIRE